ncbi:MAG: hypothetical protein CL908_07295 [Deltaproteobacteria bacterium]|nr:hypothetical protein [Deltaproteobacteria bacterium]
MHSTRRSNGKNWTVGALLAAGLLLAGGAEAGDRQRDDDRRIRRHPARETDRQCDHHFERHRARRDSRRSKLHAARRYNHELDRRGAMIDGHFDLLAFVAVAAGDFELAWALDRTGDRIEHRYDRRGDHALRHARKRSMRHAHHHRGCGHGFASHRVIVEPARRHHGRRGRHGRH